MRTIGELLTKLYGCFRTIHINTLAVFDESAWVSVITTVNFSMDDHKEEIVSHAEGELIIVKAILPYQKLGELKEWFKEGRLKFLADGILLPQNTDLDQLNCNLDRYTTPNWPAFHYESSVGNFKPEMSNNIRNQCAKFGYGDLRPLAKYELLISEYALDRIANAGNKYLEINIPIYARVEKNSIQLNKNGISVVVSHHGQIKSLILQVEYINQQNRGLYFITRGIPPTTEIISEHALTLDYKEDENVQYLILTLTDKELGKLYEEYVTMRDLIVKSEIVNNPLFSALLIFTPKEKFQQILLAPGSDTAKKTVRPQDVFEETVSKFLSASGFSSIRLNGHEEIRDVAGNVIGSADIIAYDNNNGKLFVVSCKTSMPDRNAVDWIKASSQEVRDRLPEFLSKVIDVVPIIFTSQMSPALKEESKKYGVTIIDKPDLEELFGLSQTKQLTYNDLMK